MTYLCNNALETHRSCSQISLLIEKDARWPFESGLLIDQVRILLCVNLDLVVSICLPMRGKHNDGLGLHPSDILAYGLQSTVDWVFLIVHDTGLASKG